MACRAGRRGRKKKEWDAFERYEGSAVFAAKQTHNCATQDEAKCCIYCEWPELARDAGEYEWFEKCRKGLAFEFYKRRAVSISGAASMAGLSYEDFMGEMGRRGISMW